MLHLLTKQQALYNFKGEAVIFRHKPRYCLLQITTSFVGADKVCSLLQPLGSDVIAWFAARKVSRATLQHNQIQQYMFKGSDGDVQWAIAFVQYTTTGISEVKIRTLSRQWKHYFAIKGQGTLYGVHN